ncbi:hypothetical protein CPB83DRAFT_853661 [Crepidotus variabilis]|uniref:Uncharacterized protein n=1 Tax=Crepidotus variabilis TaxID=179855 RepID=A0A9P6EH01_9AGAR|nr:hypothetical protein CPB83DRAFT_853661 [Crepidotus variabilis]
MSTVYTEFIFWAFLALVNLGISMLVFNSTRLELKQKVVEETTPYTRPIYTGPAFPSSFTYLSFATGFLNLAGAYLRLLRIHFLHIPTIPWLHQAFWEWLGKGGETRPELKALLDAEWLVAMNDWTSLVLAATFFLSACFNFATVRQLVLKKRWTKEILLPAVSPTISTSAEKVTDHQGGATSEKQHIRGRSFSVYVHPYATRS